MMKAPLVLCVVVTVAMAVLDNEGVWEASHQLQDEHGITDAPTYEDVMKRHYQICCRCLKCYRKCIRCRRKCCCLGIRCRCKVCRRDSEEDTFPMSSINEPDNNSLIIKDNDVKEVEEVNGDVGIRMCCRCRRCSRRCRACGRSCCCRGSGGCRCRSCSAFQRAFGFELPEQSTNEIKEQVNEAETKEVEEVNGDVGIRMCCQCRRCSQRCRACGRSCCCRGSGGCRCRSCSAFQHAFGFELANEDVNRQSPDENKEQVEEVEIKKVEEVNEDVSLTFCCYCRRCYRRCRACGRTCCCRGGGGCKCRSCSLYQHVFGVGN